MLAFVCPTTPCMPVDRGIRSTLGPYRVSVELIHIRTRHGREVLEPAGGGRGRRSTAGERAAAAAGPNLSALLVVFSRSPPGKIALESEAVLLMDDMIDDDGGIRGAQVLSRAEARHSRKPRRGAII